MDTIKMWRSAPPACLREVMKHAAEQ
jgi:hypothetical protein